MLKSLSFKIVMLCLSLLSFMQMNGQETQHLYLSGTGSDHTVNWQFFCTAGQNSGKWTTIPVPSNWELQGFGKYDYGWAKDTARGKESGFYKYKFKVPSNWSGKTINIVFEGSMTDTEVTTQVETDLGLGERRVRPDPAMGYQACLNSHPGKVEEGSIGAGTGALLEVNEGLEPLLSRLDDVAHQAAGLAVVACIRVEIGPDAVAQADRLADVDDRPGGVLHDVAARLGGQRFQDPFEMLRYDHLC